MKHEKFGFIILSPEYKTNYLKSTLASIKNFYSECPVLCVTGKHTPDETFNDIKTLCKAIKGGETITSLINTGMDNGYAGWNIFLMEGAHAGYNLSNKLFKFIESEKDILFPIDMDFNREHKPIKIYMDFHNSTLNGLTIHQNTFKKVGNMMHDGTLEEARLEWGCEAIRQGCGLKAILGARLV